MENRNLNALDNLPVDLARHRVLDTAESAAFCNYSIPHWRRMYRTGDAPKPLKLGARKLGWRIGDLVDWLASRAREAA
jgi:prophage regulatory protein